MLANEGDADSLGRYLQPDKLTTSFCLYVLLSVVCNFLGLKMVKKQKSLNEGGNNQDFSVSLRLSLAVNGVERNTLLPIMVI